MDMVFFLGGFVPGYPVLNRSISKLGVGRACEHKRVIIFYETLFSNSIKYIVWENESILSCINLVTTSFYRVVSFDNFIRCSNHSFWREIVSNIKRWKSEVNIMFSLIHLVWACSEETAPKQTILSYSFLTVLWIHQPWVENFHEWLWQWTPYFVQLLCGALRSIVCISFKFSNIFLNSWPIWWSFFVLIFLWFWKIVEFLNSFIVIFELLGILLKGFLQILVWISQS